MTLQVAHKCHALWEEWIGKYFCPLIQMEALKNLLNQNSAICSNGNDND